MNGRTLVERLRKSVGSLKALLMSGYTDDAVLLRGVLQDEVVFLAKPFTPQQLLKKVREALLA